MKKIVSILIIILILAVGLSYIFAVNSKGHYKSQNFYIEKGDGSNEIAEKLKDRGIIGNKLYFKIYSVLSGKASKFVPGDHVLPADLNYGGIAEKLIDAGNINKEQTITILEGWSANEIANYLNERDVITKEEFMAVASIDLWRGKYSFLQDPKIKSLEGYLFPDTYRIFIDASPSSIIEKMLNNFEVKVTEQMKTDLAQRGLSLNEAIIMASIIEKEGKYANDKKMISDIFWKRIDAKMALQSDATINYLTGKGETRSKGSDLEIDSPYNTYKYRGLTPGPIANPGLNSIVASIYPTANDFYYFITDKNGKAYFAKTFDEHKSNIAKYLE
ncbi:MAG: endolytic transglycosylase MltG [Candidatus Buchananbacteria bacterium]